MARRGRLWVISVLVAGMVCLTQFCSPPSSKEVESEAYLNHSDTAHYVGLSTCAECHYDKAQTFLHTGMGLSFDTVSLDKSSANLSQKHVLYDSALNLSYLPFWKDENLFLLEFRLNDGDTVYKRVEEITYIIGSGQHTNSHLIQKGDYVVQAPFTWYAQKGKLDFPPGFEDGNNSRFRRVITEECMSCHNGMPAMKPGSQRSFASIPQGIDCERCHGPGSIHVAMRKLGEGPEDEIDYSIVNPSRLSWERQIDVCQRCHLQGNNVLKPGKTFHDFKPGMVLADVFEIYLPKYAGDNQLFNMANHSDRFQNSKCFIKTNGGRGETEFTCITCHNPHVSVKSTSSDHFNRVCETCHGSKDVCSELLKVRMLKSDNCVECHMPVSGTEDIPHVTVHDHKIGVYDGNMSNQEGEEVIGLYSVNNPNPEARSLIEAYLTYYEKFDPLPIYQQRAAELLKEADYPELRIHLHYQQQKWKELVGILADVELEDPKGITCYRIGKAYSYLGDLKRAKEWLSLAVVKEESYFEYKSELASNLLKMNDYAEAERLLKACLTQFEEYNPALNNLGFLYIAQGQFGKAKKYLDKSLSLDPDNVNGLENMVLLYSTLKNTEKEVFWLKRLLSVRPTHEVAKNRLSQLS